MTGGAGRVAGGRPTQAGGPPPDLAVLDDPRRWAEFARLGLADGEVDGAVDRLTALAARLVGARWAQVSLLGQEQVVASTAGFSLPPGLRRQPLVGSLCSVCVAGGEPLVIAEAPRHPWVRDLPPVQEGRVRRYLGVPLVTAAGAGVGALCVFDDSDAPWPDDAVSTVAELAAVVVRTLELGNAARQLTVTAHRLHRLQEVTSRIATAATVEEIAEVVLDQGIALVAPRGVVGVLTADRSALQTWSGLGLPPDVVAEFGLLRWGASTQVSETVRTGAPVVLHSPSEIHTRFPETAHTYAAAGVRSAMALPGRLGDRVVAVLAFGFEAENGVDDEGVAVAQALADLTAQAVDRARAYEHDRDAARSLQHALLPAEPDPQPGTQVAVRYLPADHDVGGDWYDVFPLPGGRLGVAVGDVVGHDLPAAVTMGRLQAVLRAFALTADGPAEVLDMVEAVAPVVGRGMVATAGYGEYDPSSGRFRYACAGHLPPLLVDGVARYLWEGRSAPLGVGQPGRPQAEVVVPPGALLIWCTDGLVERRDDDLDAGLDRLAELAQTLPGDPEAACGRIMERMIGGHRLYDDIALVCVSISRSPRRSGAAGRRR